MVVKIKLVNYQQEVIITIVLATIITLALMRHLVTVLVAKVHFLLMVTVMMMSMQQWFIRVDHLRLHRQFQRDN